MISLIAGNTIRPLPSITLHFFVFDPTEQPILSNMASDDTLGDEDFFEVAPFGDIANPD